MDRGRNAKRVRLIWVNPQDACQCYAEPLHGFSIVSPAGGLPRSRRPTVVAWGSAMVGARFASPVLAPKGQGLLFGLDHAHEHRHGAMTQQRDADQAHFECCGSLAMAHEARARSASPPLTL